MAAKKQIAVKNQTEPKNGNGKLSEEQLRYFMGLLLDKRRQLVGDVNNIQEEALKSARTAAAGDLSAMPIHMADMGTDTYDQELALNLADSERKLLRKIDEALLRISDGSYGICQGTGKKIQKARLKAKPWARFCVEYAEMIEKGLVSEEPQ